jgi:hypothetical protein
MPLPSPSGRHGALTASLRWLPRSLIHPVVLTFLVAAYFSDVTGDTVRAGYLLAVGLALTWDQARRRVLRPPAGTAQANPGGGQANPGGQANTGEGQADPGNPVQMAFSGESADRRRAAMRRWLWPAVLAGITYSLVVGSLQRYSWPVTVAVNIPAVAGVLVAWRVSAGSKGTPARLSRAGVAAWAVVWAGAAVWELTALYLQPSLTTDSYAHPTLSVLANPVLHSVPGRAAVLFAWLAFGWYLARR